MHFHFICAGAKKIFTCLFYLCVPGNVIIQYLKTIIIFYVTARKEIIMLKKAVRVFSISQFYGKTL